jgi:Tol biopolymer transport system component
LIGTKFAKNPAWSRDGRQLAYQDHDEVPSDTPYVIGIPEIYVVNVSGTGRRRLTRNEEDDLTPTWTPAGRIVFASFREGPLRLYVMNRDGSGVRRFQ